MVLEPRDVTVVAGVDLLVHALQHVFPIDRIHSQLLRDALHAGGGVEDRLGEVDLTSGSFVARGDWQNCEYGDQKLERSPPTMICDLKFYYH